MADDERRVEPQHLFLGQGYRATPDRIEALRLRQKEVERMRRPAPTRKFSNVLAAERKPREGDADQEALNEKDKRTRELPLKGPQPSLVHPCLRDVYGRSEEGADEIILKG